MEAPDALPSAMFPLFERLHAQPVVGTLLLLMLLDILTGLCAGIVRKRLSSTISWRGMSRKVVMLLLIGFGVIIEPFCHEIPMGKLVALFYVVTEALSILENAAISGVPLPQALVDVLIKLRESNSACESAHMSSRISPSLEIKVLSSTPCSETEKTTTTVEEIHTTGNIS